MRARSFFAAALKALGHAVARTRCSSVGMGPEGGAAGLWLAPRRRTR